MVETQQIIITQYPPSSLRERERERERGRGDQQNDILNSTMS